MSPRLRKIQRLTATERALMHRALGFDRPNGEVRNGIHADEESSDMPMLRDLQDRRYMDCQASAVTPYLVFTVTELGWLVLGLGAKTKARA